MKPTVDQILRKAATLAQKGESAAAEAFYRDVIARFPGNQRALDGLDALSTGQQATAMPEHEGAALIALYNQGRCREVIEQAAQLRLRYAATPVLLTIEGAALARLGALEQSLACYDRALTLSPDFADAHNNRGIVLKQMRRFGDAMASYDLAIRFAPRLASAHNNRGNILRELGRPQEALASFAETVRLAPDLAAAHASCGDALLDLRRFTEAIASYDRALSLQHRTPDIYAGRGYALSSLGRLEEAVASYDLAIALKPDDADIRVNRANALVHLHRIDEAIAGYERALVAAPQHDAALGLMLHEKAKTCDWSAPAQPVDLARLGIGRSGISPFAMLSLDDDPARQLARARTWASTRIPAAAAALPKPGARPERLRIGYFSSDYHDHAVMFLMARSFELHDKQRFELHAFSYGPDKQDAMRGRVAAAFDHFHDVRTLSNPAVAELARAKGIDIAVDLSGYTREDRTEIFAHRAAPVQINYLGFPGTMGTDFLDYVIADRIVAPSSARPCFSEKVINLPHCYQANDDRRVISDRVFTRSELGLPEHGFVFSSFNNNYKITPAEFDIWMRLLAQVEDSVLWLLEANAWTKANLRREAGVRGMDPDRLVFAGRVPLADHLARHRHADLFLDTFNYNAHTTASDALWTGLPLVTKAGRSFASRVAASLLTTIGMPELITDTAEAYEALALNLATDAALLAAMRAKLAANRLATPLFDSAGFTRDIERAYDLAYARRAAGLPAEHMDLAAA